jgi:VWFA-related protein
MATHHAADPMGSSGQITNTLVRRAGPWPAALALFIALTPSAGAIQQSSSPPKSDQSEITTHEAEPTFTLKSERNLVLVRVIVRDAKGNPQGNLKKEDFRLLDKGKPQTITHFTLETPRNAGTQAGGGSLEPTGGTSARGPEDAGITPHRFLAMFFDDVHLEISDLMRVQQAATRYVTHAVLPGDRIGVFTSSGQNQVDFTDDLEKVGQSISHILPRPVTRGPEGGCPQVFDYQAFMIVEQRDQFAMQIAEEEYYHCNCEQLEGIRDLAAQCRNQASVRVEQSAMEVFSTYETNTQASLRSLEQATRHLATFPGQRIMVLVSPGFLTRAFEVQVDQIVDRALRANITINTLDSKGLYAPLPGGDDISDRPIITPRRPDLVGHKEQYRLDRIAVADEPLIALAADTGGIFFHNNNDLGEGFSRAGALPDVYYTLGFSPTNMKEDGQFHSLKVSLARTEHLDIQARRGYFAPSGNADPVAKAKDEIEEAVFSQDDLNELPIEVHTQFFRVDDSSARLSVLTHLDLRTVHFRKQEGRNLDNLTLVTVLFDRDGKFVKGMEKTLEMRLKDSSLEQLGRLGITMKTSFDVKPGAYVIRQVVRDAEGAQLSGLSRPIEIR